MFIVMHWSDKRASTETTFFQTLEQARAKKSDLEQYASIDDEVIMFKVDPIN